jgi:hypothetical protein
MEFNEEEEEPYHGNHQHLQSFEVSSIHQPLSCKSGTSINGPVNSSIF